MSNDSVPTIYCSKECQSIAETAEVYGYTAPPHRVGTGNNSRPRDGETVVAMVKAGRYSLPVPIFRREGKNEVSSNQCQ